MGRDLGRLEQSLARDSVSLKWSVEAMSLLKKMQVELLVLFKKSKLPISYGAEEDWFDQYMKETATLLDFCNSLKSAASGINRYRMVVELAIHKLGEDNSSNMVDVNNMEFERFKRVHGNLLDVGVMRETLRLGSGISSGGNHRQAKSMAVVMLAAKTTMIVLSLLLVSAMVSPVSIDMGNGAISHEVPQLKPCVELLTQLVGRFHERTSRPGSGSGLALVEHEMVDEVVGRLKAQVVAGRVEDKERFLGGVELLRTRSAGLSEEVERFDAAVDEVFEEVIRGRNEMLGIFRDGAVSGG
ncbi:protein BPS1, chloroplastic-like isoform X2 [Phoenix dactylifera]|uniref:Protein BPS1, chloroplastic-like isoform X2 n=1 Tax=Phoenix dactylifera TaxID=42345 RepID=A0A8B7MTX7_PHODC|nr:protein BPS1, chloroplastic-like isoform X2 [Phoenix dactylifera]